ncbi:hypothetical protein BLA6863_01928 [Burkholderia lata]|uniref:Uncharacterized protein n=1 Tax=Burkholderia lata (strain ATCC 17760 / DSM 23089 / LMG 22485 / NCIMB 9086 / R18194 / 383) TaxID=482957 RepID=A0A6P2JGF1_BURL3|nr:hypothetical protein BLA6863_01928 [Burkholderia lata]
MCNCHEDPAEPEGATCIVCGCETGEADFELVDDEFNEAHPMCPACQAESRMRGQCCEYCDNPAEYETESGFLCCDHHSDYVDAYVARD